MIDVYSIYTEKHKPLFEKFSRSLPRNVNLYAKFSSLEGGNFQTKGFVQVIYEKLFFLRNVVKKSIGKIIVFSDVDIIVVRDFENIVRTELAEHDMVFQSQDNPAEPFNVGFWGIKCSELTAEFLDKLCSYSEEDYSKKIEQTLINELILSDEWKNRLKVKSLPREFFAVHLDWDHWMTAFPPEVILFHATNRSDVASKILTVDQFIQSVKNPELMIRLADCSCRNIHIFDENKMEQQTTLSVKHSVNRKYLPTFAELIDRLSIVQMKAIFIPKNKDKYEEEISFILHDLDEILKEHAGGAVNAKMIHAILVVMLTNRFIWENESKARQGGSEQDKLLKLTHSINGVRNTAKNVIAQEMGERVDLKVDALAAELVKEFGNWNIWPPS